MQLIKTEGNVSRLYPTEWVGRKTTAATHTKFTFVQVAYKVKNLEEYRVFSKANDYEGEDVNSSDLIQLGACRIRACGDSAFPQSEPEFKQSEPNKDLGSAWMKQVDVDFKILKHLHLYKLELNEYATICFLAQQVAEKAMTAAIIFFIGDQVENIYRKHDLIDGRWEHLSEFIGDIERLELHANVLNDYYLKTRYPNRWKNGKIPADNYDIGAANKAFESACEIRRIIQTSMDENKNSS